MLSQNVSFAFRANTNTKIIFAVVSYSPLQKLTNYEDVHFWEPRKCEKGTLKEQSAYNTLMFNAFSRE